MHILYGSYMLGWGLGDWLLMLFYWLVILSLIGWVIGGSESYADDGKTTLEILKARYAKGDISEEDFKRMKKELV